MRTVKFPLHQTCNSLRTLLDTLVYFLVSKCVTLSSFVRLFRRQILIAIENPDPRDRWTHTFSNHLFGRTCWDNWVEHKLEIAEKTDCR